LTILKVYSIEQVRKVAVDSAGRGIKAWWVEEGGDGYKEAKETFFQWKIIGRAKGKQPTTKEGPTFT